MSGTIRPPTPAYYSVDSDEGVWNTGRDEKPNLGYKIPYKRGYFPVPPTDSLQDLRTEMMLNLIEGGHRSRNGSTTKSALPVRPKST